MVDIKYVDATVDCKTLNSGRKYMNNVFWLVLKFYSREY